MNNINKEFKLINNKNVLDLTEITSFEIINILENILEPEDENDDDDENKNSNDDNNDGFSSTPSLAFEFTDNKKIELYIREDCEAKDAIEKDYYELKTQLKDMIDINKKDEIEHIILLFILSLFFNIPIDLEAESFKVFDTETKNKIKNLHTLEFYKKKLQNNEQIDKDTLMSIDLESDSFKALDSKTQSAINQEIVSLGCDEYAEKEKQQSSTVATEMTM